MEKMNSDIRVQGVKKHFPSFLLGWEKQKSAHSRAQIHTSGLFTANLRVKARERGKLGLVLEVEVHSKTSRTEVK